MMTHMPNTPFLPPDPIPELMAATFTPGDAAFATGIENFNDFRKNGERVSDGSSPLFHFPRKESARAEYRLAHIYEYGLFHNMLKATDRATASLYLRGRYGVMARNMNHRYFGLPADVREAIDAGYKGEDRQTHATFQIFVDYPWLAFDPNVLDRSEERLAKPIIWTMAGDVDSQQEGDITIADLYRGIDADINQNFTQLTEGGDYLAKNPVIILNVTRILTEIDRKLTVRLRSRKLRGE